MALPGGSALKKQMAIVLRAAGFSSKQIAVELGYTVCTVDGYWRNGQPKLVNNIWMYRKGNKFRRHGKPEFMRD